MKKYLYEYLREDKLEYDLQVENIKVYASDCCGLGKNDLIKKEIKKKENYYYFSLIDNINKDELYKKLKKYLIIEIKINII